MGLRDDNRRQGGPLHPTGYQQIVGLVAATALTIPNGSKVALIMPTGQQVRWRDDGTDPTTSVGMPLAIGDAYYYVGELGKIKFIQEAATATLNISYYG